MPRSIIDTLTPFAIYGGLGFLLLRRGANGKSILDGVTQSISKGIQIPGAPGTVAPAASSASAQPGPNSGADQFNFNATDSKATYHEFGTTIDGHAGFGHIGAGGVASLIVEARDGGFFGSGALSGDYVKIYETTVSVGGDADWAGYGVDFSGASTSSSPGPFHNLQIRYSLALRGVHMTDLELWADKALTG